MVLRLVIASAWSAAISAIVAMWAATQFVAWYFHGHKSLGEHLFWIDGLGKIYAPWSFLEWWWLWGGDLPILSKVRLIAAGMFLALTALGVRGFLKSDKARDKDAIGTEPEWGGERELRKLGLMTGRGFGDANGVVLGMLPNGRLIVYTGEAHVLCSGVSEVGKTVGFVVPTILSIDHRSAVIFDTKGELWELTGKHRASLGPAFFFDPTNPDSACLNPFADVRMGEKQEVGDIQNLISALVAGSGEAPKGEKSEFYAKKVKGLLLGVALHILYDIDGVELSFPAISRLMPDFEDKVLPAMEKSGNELVRKKATEFMDEDGGVRKNILSTAKSLLEVFDDPLLCEKMETSDFSFNDLMTGPDPVTVYLQIRGSESERLKPLLLLIARAVIDRNLYADRVTDDGRKKVRRCALVLEELADSGMRFIVNKMLTMRSKGFSVVAVTQSIDDLKREFGMLQTIDASSYAVITHASTSRNEQQYSSDGAGQKMEQTTRVTREKGLLFYDPEKSISVSSHKSPLLSRTDVRGFPSDRQMLVVRGEKKAFLPHKVIWYKHPLFKELGVNNRAADFEDTGQSAWILEKHTKRERARAEAASRMPSDTDLAFISQRTGWDEKKISEHVFDRRYRPLVVKKWMRDASALPRQHAGYVTRIREEIEAMGGAVPSVVVSRLLDTIDGQPAIRRLAE